MNSEVNTSYINAFSLFIACKSLGVKLFTTHQKPFTPIPKIKKSISTEYLFFTEEKSLREAIKSDSKKIFYPRDIDIDLIDNKYNLSKSLASNLKKVRIIPQEEINENYEKHFPVIIKSKTSWLNGRETKRGWICNSKNEYLQNLKNLKENGYKLKDFFIQKWIKTKKSRNLSVCVFYDFKNKKRNLNTLVERIEELENQISGSIALETVLDKLGLIKESEKLLEFLKYKGPYEIEFIESEGNTYFLELNPRFWMQNSIFYPHKNGLVKRYLNLDNEEDHKIKTLDYTFWIDGIFLVQSIMLFRLKYLFLLLKKVLIKRKCIVISPPLNVSFLIVFNLNIVPKFLTLLRILKTR